MHDPGLMCRVMLLEVTAEELGFEAAVDVVVVAAAAAAQRLQGWS